MAKYIRGQSATKMLGLQPTSACASRVVSAGSCGKTRCSTIVQRPVKVITGILNIALEGRGASRAIPCCHSSWGLASWEAQTTCGGETLLSAGNKEVPPQVLTLTRTQPKANVLEVEAKNQNEVHVQQLRSTITKFFIFLMIFCHRRQHQTTICLCNVQTDLLDSGQQLVPNWKSSMAMSPVKLLPAIPSNMICGWENCVHMHVFSNKKCNPIAFLPAKESNFDHLFLLYGIGKSLCKEQCAWLFHENQPKPWRPIQLQSKIITSSGFFVHEEIPCNNFMTRLQWGNKVLKNKQCVVSIFWMLDWEGNSHLELTTCSNGNVAGW